MELPGLTDLVVLQGVGQARFGDRLEVVQTGVGSGRKPAGKQSRQPDQNDQGGGGGKGKER